MAKSEEEDIKKTARGKSTNESLGAARMEALQQTRGGGYTQERAVETITPRGTQNERGTATEKGGPTQTIHHAALLSRESQQ